MPTLLVMQDLRCVRRIRIPEGEVRIGRGADNEIVLPSLKVSRIHALLNCRGSQATIKDAGSTNGIFVNGERIGALQVLDGDRLQLGDIELLFCRMDDPTADAVQPRRAPDFETGLTVRAGLDIDDLTRAPPSHGHAQSVGEGVAFTLPMRGREVSALITYDALASHFGVCAFGEDSSGRAVDAYEENHLAIHVAATYRYQQDQEEPVVLRARDF